MPELNTAPADASLSDSDALLTLGFEHVTLGALKSYLGLGSPPVVAISTSTHNLVEEDVGAYSRFTYAGAASATVQPNATEPMPDNAEIHFRAVGGDLTLVAGSGVTINSPAGGTLVIPQGGTATIKRVATDEWDLFGQVVPA